MVSHQSSLDRSEGLPAIFLLNSHLDRVLNASREQVINFICISQRVNVDVLIVNIQSDSISSVERAQGMRLQLR